MKNSKFFLGIILLVVSAAAGYFLNKNQLLNFKQEKTETPTAQAQVPTTSPTPNFPKVIGDFLATDREVCLQDGKPKVYFFGSASCPHCVWEKPIATGVFDQFKDAISYFESYDSSDNSEVILSYNDVNPGYIPFLVLGCKYVRIGAGENLGTTDGESQKLETGGPVCYFV